MLESFQPVVILVHEMHGLRWERSATMRHQLQFTVPGSKTAKFRKVARRWHLSVNMNLGVKPMSDEPMHAADTVLMYATDVKLDVCVSTLQAKLDPRSNALDRWGYIEQLAEAST